MTKEQGDTPKKRAYRRRKDIPAPIMASSLSDEKSTLIASREGSSGFRQNIAGLLNRTNRFAFVENGVAPFGIKHLNKGSGDVSPQDAIRLCQMAYYNIPIFKNTIDLMTEFTVSPIFFSGGNALSRNFFTSWSKKINMWSFEDKFFREYYRSGNVFTYKLLADFSRQDILKLNKIFGADATSIQIPGKYIILNPADIETESCCWLDYANFYKIINSYELGLLTNKQNDIDSDIADRIPELAQLQKNSGQQIVKILLDRDRVRAVFYKKQDYELCSIPLGFPVLEDINAKEELKKIDIAISRTIQQAVLLVTMGNQEDGAPSKENMSAMRQLFENESVGRVLIAPFDTEVKFVIPAIGDILDPKKYEILEKDIRLGLNNVLFGEDKYSNTDIKVEVFLARLKHAREAFLREFLIPEMEAIGKVLNFKSIPFPEFEESDFKDDALRARIYTRLIEIGTLTPEEGITAIKTGRLPTKEESLQSQKEFKPFRDNGLYTPIMNSGAGSGDLGGSPGGDIAAPNGDGNKVPSVPGGNKTGKGSSEGIDNISVKNIQKISSSIDKLTVKVEKQLCLKYSVKKISAEQKEAARTLVDVIISNEEFKKWDDSVTLYIDNPMKSNKEVFGKITDVIAKHGLTATDIRSAALLYHASLV